MENPILDDFKSAYHEPGSADMESEFKSSTTERPIESKKYNLNCFQDTINRTFSRRSKARFKGNDKIHDDMDISAIRIHDVKQHL